MKTAASVLQELMVKLGDIPEYECISQTGPQYTGMFEFKCLAHDHVVSALARTKKEAKQEAARLMLRQLAHHGLPVPPPYGLFELQTPSSSASCGSPPADQLHGPRSYVALLKELCEEYRLPAAEFELASDTGPAHERRFVMRVRVGRHERLAAASTKKMAKQRAAEMLYGYLRANLARLTDDFVEEDALVRATAKAMDKYLEIKKEAPWRPDLSQKISDYHLGFANIEKEQRAAALAALESGAEPEAAVRAAAAELGLQLITAQLATGGAPLQLLQLKCTSPPLVFAGRESGAAYAAAAAYLRDALRC